MFKTWWFLIDFCHQRLRLCHVLDLVVWCSFNCVILNDDTFNFLHHPIRMDIHNCEFTCFFLFICKFHDLELWYHLHFISQEFNLRLFQIYSINNKKWYIEINYPRIFMIIVSFKSWIYQYRLFAIWIHQWMNHFCKCSFDQHMLLISNIFPNYQN